MHEERLNIVMKGDIAEESRDFKIFYLNLKISEGGRDFI